jgi:hypothetical protein
VPPRAPEVAPEAFSAAPAPPVARADPFAAPAAPAVYHGGWGAAPQPATNAFAAAAADRFAAPPPAPAPQPMGAVDLFGLPAAAPPPAPSLDVFGGSVAPSTVSSTTTKKAAPGFDFDLHSTGLVSLNLCGNGAAPRAASARKAAPAVAMNKMQTAERRSSMLSTEPLGAPAHAMGMPPVITAHPAFARYTPAQQQWLLQQPPHVQQQYLQ